MEVIFELESLQYFNGMSTISYLPFNNFPLLHTWRLLVLQAVM
jgi:hypothetical protein